MKFILLANVINIESIYIKTNKFMEMHNYVKTVYMDFL